MLRSMMKFGRIGRNIHAARPGPLEQSVPQIKLKHFNFGDSYPPSFSPTRLVFQIRELILPAKLVGSYSISIGINRLTVVNGVSKLRHKKLLTRILGQFEREKASVRHREILIWWGLVETLQLEPLGKLLCTRR